MSEYPKDYFYFKAIRDPLYGFIDLSELETKVIDSEIFRRLHLIKQLSHAFVVYPSAIHSRFEHSLGATYVADKISERIDLTFEERELVRLAILVHDIGHGPFSHLFENVLNSINTIEGEVHEEITQIIIREDPELSSILDKKQEPIAEILKEKKTHEKTVESLMHSIISGGLDADKFDYLRRDSYHIGVTYGLFDLERILHTISTTKKRSQILIDHKGQHALENYRLGRYLMHVQVYEHHARLAADQMFLNALDIAIFDEGVINKDLLSINKNGSNDEFLKFYRTLDDYSIYQKIIEDKNSKFSKEILENIKKRNLLKRACEFTPKNLEKDQEVNIELMKMKTREDFKNFSKDIAESLKIAPHEVIFYKSNIKDKLYKRGGILIRKNNDIIDLSDDSPIKNIEESTIKYFVFGPNNKDMRKKIAEKTAEKLSVSVEKITQ